MIKIPDGIEVIEGRSQVGKDDSALKRELVGAALAPGSSVSAVARRYGISSSLLFR